MASPCEVLVRSTNQKFIHSIAQLVTVETLRIEKKYSRYIKNNLVDRMNCSNGNPVTIDQETYQLLEYSRNLFELSEGLFDITSGIFRKIWSYKADSIPPSQEQIDSLLKHIGFEKINYNQSQFTMPKSMEIDFGGIGKEYAVDQVYKILDNQCGQNRTGFLINFGGDIAAMNYSSDDSDWVIGLERIDQTTSDKSLIKIYKGAVATSGNSRQFFEYQGKRYGHLINPKTGYPIDGAPLSVTTFANSCVLAGSYSSLAMLQGKQAEIFLKEQDINFICNW